MKEYLRIGDLARLFHLDVQTLRLYEEKELLLPEGREPGSNYRYYRSDQAYSLALIRYLRRLECPLSEIHAFMCQRSFTETCSYLHHQSESLQERLQELLRLDAVIQMKIAFTERELQELCVDKISVEHLDAMHYLALGNLNEVFSNEQFYLYPTLAFYRDTKQSFGAYLIGEIPENCIHSVHIIPAGSYLTGYHVGPFKNIHKTFSRMRYATKLHLSQDIICVNIIDQFVEVNPENYITKILIKILDKDIPENILSKNVNP